MDDKTIFKFQKQLKKLTKRGSQILISILTSQRRGIKNARSPDKLTELASLNIFTKPSSQADRLAFLDLIDKAFNFGINYGIGKDNVVAKGLSDIAISSSDKFLSKLGNDIRTEALDIISRGLKDPDVTFNDMKDQLINVLDIKESRANSIARTEVARSANSASYIQAKQEGAMYYTVDNRAEACEICQDKFEGQTFPISDTDSLPPEHPNCACVPVYFRMEDEANNWNDRIASENEDIRQRLEDQGKDIKPDGTSNFTNN